MIEDTVDYGIVGDECDYAHLALALGTDYRIEVINFLANLGSVAAGNLGPLLLNDQEVMLILLCLSCITTMSIGAEAKVTDHNLLLVGEMGGDTHDEFQAVHLISLLAFFLTFFS